MEESQELEKLPRVVTSVLKVILSFSLIALALVLIIALAKITYTLAIMVFNTSSVVPYDVILFSCCSFCTLCTQEEKANTAESSITNCFICLIECL